MTNYKKFKEEKLKQINESIRAEILPDGEEWRAYFDNYVLTDTEYIVYYNINNIIYLYNKTNDMVSIVGSLDDLLDPIDNNSIVDAINYVWLNGQSGTVSTTDMINTINPTAENGDTQQEVNENNKEAIDSVNQEINDILSGDVSIINTTDKVNTINSTAENGATQQEVNENNKASIDSLDSETDNLNTEIDGLNDEIDVINQQITDINNDLPDLTDYYTKSEVDSMLADLQSQINACCGTTTKI